MNRIGRIRVLVLVGVVLLLELLCRTAVIDPLAMIPPSAMASALWDLLRSGKIMPDLVKTLRNVAAAMALSIPVGFALGVAIHAWPRLRHALDPFFATYYAVPFFVFYPLLILIFGLNDLPIVLIGFMFAVVAMIVNTLNGLDRIPRVLVKVARVHRMSRLDRAWALELPAAAPYLFSGMKLAVAYSFIGVIASEFILSGAGLGYAIAFAYNNFDNRTMYGLMLFIVTLVTAINVVLHVWERRLLDRRRRA
jgi:NitT/TauT family transport system permease protein